MKMAGATETTYYYAEELALLQSMFGVTVSKDVIATVIESCYGDVNQAADIIINFAKEPSSLYFETAMMNLPNEPSPPYSKTEDNLNIAKDTTTDYSQDAANMNQINEPTTVLSQGTINQDNEPTLYKSDSAAGKGRFDNTITKPIKVAPAVSNAEQQPSISTISIPQDVTDLSITLSKAFRNTGAIPRTNQDSNNTNRSQRKNNIWPDQIKKILTHHTNGARTLILMRGASGSGKTYLAQQIVDYTVGASSENYARHIFSTDSYFMRGGVYQFNRHNLPEAHMINQKKVCDAANKGVSPIIVDNTNTEIWEMEPYARDGIRNGYIIEIAEPKTHWSRNANQLAKRNLHNVPRENIIRMLDRYQNITPECLLKALRLSYPANIKLPVKRNIPIFSLPEPPSKSDEKKSLKIVKYDANLSDSATTDTMVNVLHYKSPDSPNGKINNVADSSTSGRIETTNNEGGLLNTEYELKLQKIKEAQKQIETYEKVEIEWDNGDSWDVSAKNTIDGSQDQAAALDPKPPRQTYETGKLIEPADICDDWTKISMFMSPWQDDTISKPTLTIETPKPVENKDESTCVEVGDWNNSNFQILYTHPRNITDVMPDANNQMKRLKIMVDKSTSTHDHDMLVILPECEHKELHFKAFRRMFKSAPRDELRVIFDNCKSDVNWAVNLILDDYPEWTRNTEKNDEASDPEEESIEVCQCLAAYNIIPDVTASSPVLPIPEKTSKNSTPLPPKKSKRDVKISESSLQLKRQIEHNVMISKVHYSEKHMQLRKRREYNVLGHETTSSLNTSAGNPEDIPTLELDNATALPEAYTHKYSLDSDVVRPSSPQYDAQFMISDESDSESESSKSENLDQLVSVNLGPEFLKTLDGLFGRTGFEYPENIQPTVSLPMSILRQINAHWAMSVATQLDNESRKTESIIKQDEEFARKLAAKEEEMSKEGQEPVVPTLKEIMDMELAYSIYEKNVAEWRNNEPQDFAARLSREKLYNLFPHLSQDVLSEMLMAHGYSFKATVESLLVSTGQTNWLEDEKGVEKFVMNKEMERKTKFLEEENKSLSEVEWPYLTDPEKPVNLETVNHYRAEAQRHLETRNAIFEKARQYFSRNSPSAASFYSEIAALHTKKYEHFSCLAAAYLMNYHLRNNPDRDVLDLHYLRVAEAMVNLDIFLDQIILKLRNNNTTSKEVWIITGKGTHSVGGPRIKPATKRRLLARNVPNKQVNGGLLTAVLYSTNKMTNELAESENL